ncbi:glycosyltransferase [Stigmatella aurantiaca]|uniref:Glycosyl transferase, group 1 n=1 Tax=Stigmatella aurantiaca (strain DW4/3-1) TaxID=378806 RepID=Q097R7_STIAD|nr:glycosyltransferase [Stigmatella aurantiaca]ADO68416.1 Glycosyl transferase, group 1 [Stigmatella aurantiaca DW4/3-1]EAU68027.1 glycosyl transferase, group 1 [Stigmatella aurantiaca DW4/3-1]
MDKRIRLVEFTNTFHLGGGEVQFLELIRGLPRSRYDIQVLALEATGPLLPEVRKLGLEPETFPLGPSLVHPQTVRQMVRLAKWLKAQRVDLLHVHDFYTTLLAVPACRMARVPVVVGRLDLVHWHGRARHALLAAATHAANHAIANAEAVRRFMREREWFPAERVTVIRNGLRLEHFDARAVAGLESPLPSVPEGAPILTLVANMTHEVKRQEDFLEALTTVRRRHPQATAFLVGDGVRRPELEARARALGLAEAVHFLGHRTDVPAVLRRTTVGILCSRHEGLSNAVMEGMAAGLPMVVTDAGGNAELVADGERGFVVPPLSPLALAAAITRLLDEPALARRMGLAGRAFVESELTLERMVEAHDELFRRMTGFPSRDGTERSQAA